jgi:hypothetical protein
MNSAADPGDGLRTALYRPGHGVFVARVGRVPSAARLGLLQHLGPDWHVRINAESGRGRPDVLIWPKRGPGPGIVIEFSIIGRGETVALALGRATRHWKDWKDWKATRQWHRGAIVTSRVRTTGMGGERGAMSGKRWRRASTSRRALSFGACWG